MTEPTVKKELTQEERQTAVNFLNQFCGKEVFELQDNRVMIKTPRLLATANERNRWSVDPLEDLAVVVRVMNLITCYAGRIADLEDWLGKCALGNNEGSILRTDAEYEDAQMEAYRARVKDKT